MAFFSWSEGAIAPTVRRTMSGKDPGDERDEQDERDSTPPESEPVTERDSTPPDDDAAADDDAASSSSDDRARTLKSARPDKLSKKARREEEARLAKKRATTLAIGIGVVALAAGAAGGWFGHIEQGKAKLRAESAAPGNSAGTCGAWEKKICTQSGAQSLACQQAKGAASLLTTSACDVALETVPATLAKVKATRVPCDNLVEKLCKDLPQGSQTCGMIKERTPLFPPEKCKEMLGNLRSGARRGAPDRSEPAAAHGHVATRR